MKELLSRFGMIDRNSKKYFLILMVLGSLLISAFRIQTSSPILNADFENQLQGWQTNGGYITKEEDTTYNYVLTHSNTEEKIVTSQTIENMPLGWVTVSVWGKTTGKLEQAYLSLSNCTEEEKQVNLPLSRNRWFQIVLSAEVLNSTCQIKLVSKALEETQISFDNLLLSNEKTILSIRGADISSLKKSEDFGGTYAYQDGIEADALEILKSNGMNYARLRIWVNSPDDYHEINELLEMAKRLEDLNIGLLVDFHYSDSWADPGKQDKPEAWESLSFEDLQQAVYDHTFIVCKQLVDQGTPPAMVQIGNEINNGMLWPDGKTSDFGKLADLIRSGIQAVKDVSPETKIMLHIAEGGDNDLAQWWFNNVFAENVEFDVIGLSYYPFWHGSLLDLQNNLHDLAVRYDKDIIIVETAYPFTTKNNDSFDNIIKFETTPGYDATPEGQVRMLEDILTILRSTPNHHGIGYFYWDATWTAVDGNGWDPARSSSGNAWENQALFDFQNQALPSIELFNQP